MAVLCPVPKAVYLSCGEPTISRHTDYFKPLHVDCSVEYELPSCAKPLCQSNSEGGRREPLLMIHPSYYRREEARYRDPFIINLPTKLKSLENWKTPTKVTKNHNTITIAKRSQHRKRLLDVSPTISSSTGNCPCGKPHNRPTHLTLNSSSRSKDGCPCGRVHEPVVVEPIDATMWSNCGSIVEDLRTDKRLTTSSATTIDPTSAKADRNNNDCESGTINDKFRKLRRLQACVDAKDTAAAKSGVASAGPALSSSSLFASMRYANNVPHSVDAYDATAVKKSKTETFGVGSSSFEYGGADPYSRPHPFALYDPQPAIAAAAPAVLPITSSHWNCGGYFRTAGTNAISTIVRDSENMWRLFQV